MVAWDKGLTERQKLAIAERAWAWAVAHCPCLCGADLAEHSTHTHIPKVATCPGNLRSALAKSMCAVIVQHEQEES